MFSSTLCASRRNRRKFALSRVAASVGVGLLPLAVLATSSAPVGAGASAQKNDWEYNSTRQVYYGASQWQDSGFFTSHDYWADGAGYLRTAGGTPSRLVVSSGMNPTVSGHGVSISVSIAYPGQLGVGFGAGGGTCNLGTFTVAGSSLTLQNRGRLCDISSHVAVYGGDAHVTAITAWSGGNVISFGA